MSRTPGWETKTWPLGCPYGAGWEFPLESICFYWLGRAALGIQAPFTGVWSMEGGGAQSLSCSLSCRALIPPQILSVNHLLRCFFLMEKSNPVFPFQFLFVCLLINLAFFYSHGNCSSANCFWGWLLLWSGCPLCTASLTLMDQKTAEMLKKNM